MNELWQFEGAERLSGEPLTVLCSARAHSRAYWRNLLFRTVVRQQPREDVTDAELQSTDSYVSARLAAALTIVELDSPSLSGAESQDAVSAFTIPSAVMTAIDLPCAPSVLRSASVRSDARRMRAAGLAYDVSRDMAAFDAFHRGLYAPLVEQRHGDSALMVSYAEMHRHILSCELLSVTHHGDRVAGGVIRYDGGTPRLWLLGVRDHAGQALKSGVAAAVYHFAFDYLTRCGYRAVQLGYSRSFPRDGALRYKRKWGARIVGSTPNRFVLVPRATSAATRAWLAGNPLLCAQDGAIWGVGVVAEGDAHATLAQLANECPAGVAGLAAYRLRDPSSGHDAALRRVATWQPRAVAPPAAELAPAASDRAPSANAPQADPVARVGEQQDAIAARTTGQLSALAASEQCDVFHTLVAALVILLARFRGESPVSLIVELPRAATVSVDVADDMSFRGLLKEVHRRCVAASAVETIAGAAAGDPPGAARGHGFAATQRSADEPSTPRHLPDVDLELSYHGGSTAAPHAITFVYERSVFSPARIAEIARQFAQVLSRAAADADRPIGELSLITGAARQVLPDLDAPLASPWPGSVLEQFAGCAARHGHHAALIDASGTWSYRTLDGQSTRLAAHLLSAGIGEGDRVAIYADRRAALVWAMLGVMKAGAAFVIMDRREPLERLRRFARIARPCAWIDVRGRIAGDGHLAALIGESDVRVCVETPGPLDAVPLTNSAVPETPARPLHACRPESLAYVSFTSGSTGEPKAVLGAHGALSQFVPWYQRTFALAAGDRFSMLSGLAHDRLHRETLLPLQLGATVCIPPEELAHHAEGTAQWLRDVGITVVNLTPAVLTLIAREASTTTPSLRLAFVVGDVLTPRHVSWLRRLSPDIVCVNLYGTTETQQANAYYVVPRSAVDSPHDAADAREPLPVGRGIEQVQVVVLDRRADLAGIGEVGDICFRSAHLSHGYLGDAALTAEHFWSTARDAAERVRCFRTSDRGRFLPDGAVEYVARRERQVQIRDHRVELGEIEAALRTCPGIRDAVVLPRSSTEDGIQLTAYVVADAGGSSAGALRSMLRRLVPDHMVPSSIVLLDRLPLTAAGKVDRDELAASRPVPTHLDAEATSLPRSALEALLAEAWQAVLQVPAVGMHDDFFDLGGDSLAAMRVTSRIEAALHVAVSPELLFSASSLASFAESIAQRLEESAV